MLRIATHKLRRGLHWPARPAKPHLEAKDLSFVCSWPFLAASGTRRVQAPLTDPVTLVLLRLRELLLRLGSKTHRCLARQVTTFTGGKLTVFTEPLLVVFAEEHGRGKFVVGETLSLARARAVEPLLLQLPPLHDLGALALSTSARSCLAHATVGGPRQGSLAVTADVGALFARFSHQLFAEAAAHCKQTICS